MVDRSEFQIRLSKAYNLLLDSGLVHSKQQFADMVGVQRSAISNALSNNGRVLTLGLLKKVADAFPDVISREYMEHGVGEVAKKQGVPHIPYEVSAGGVGISLGAVSLNDCEMFAHVSSFGSYDFTIEVQGDSMEPELHKGDVLACQWTSAENIRSDKYYVIDTAEGAVVKRLADEGAQIVCSSINKKYHDFSVAKNDALHLALVVGVIRKY